MFCFSCLDYLETLSRTFGFDFYESTEYYHKFVAVNYGPYFVALKDRMIGKINGAKNVKNLYIQVILYSIFIHCQSHD
jgi:hypothetical protein